MPRPCFTEALRRLGVVAVLLGLGAGSMSTAVAAPTARELASARSLAEEGNEKLEARDYTAALDLFRRAQAIVPAPTVQLRIGMALEGMGKLLEAHDMLVTLSQEAAGPADPPHYRAARASAGELATSILSRTPTLTLKRDGEIAALTISLDGFAWPSSQLDAPIKVNPGRHTLVAEAPGYDPMSREVTVAEKTNTVVPLVMRSSARSDMGSLHLVLPPRGPPRMSRSSSMAPR